MVSSFFKADEAGGAITLGDNPKYASTIMTRNYFEEDKSLGKNDFSNNTFEWLYLLSHEVRHLETYREGRILF